LACLCAAWHLLRLGGPIPGWEAQFRVLSLEGPFPGWRARFRVTGTIGPPDPNTWNWGPNPRFGPTLSGRRPISTRAQSGRLSSQSAATFGPNFVRFMFVCIVSLIGLRFSAFNGVGLRPRRLVLLAIRVLVSPLGPGYCALSPPGVPLWVDPSDPSSCLYCGFDLLLKVLVFPLLLPHLVEQQGRGTPSLSGDTLSSVEPWRQRVELYLFRCILTWALLGAWVTGGCCRRPGKSLVVARRTVAAACLRLGCRWTITPFLLAHGRRGNPSPTFRSSYESRDG